jgi:hypothetical protein
VRESEIIDDIAYDEDTRELRVDLKTGRSYIYLDVPIEEYEAFDTAESLGQYYNANIRMRYEYREVTS